MGKIKVVAKKNKFINLKGKSKSKIITGGKTYFAEKISISPNNIFGIFRYKVKCDSDWSFWYSEFELKELFFDVNVSRNNKLNDLGI